jgi:hypothetical protein
MAHAELAEHVPCVTHAGMCVSVDGVKHKPVSLYKHMMPSCMLYMLLIRASRRVASIASACFRTWLRRLNTLTIITASQGHAVRLIPPISGRAGAA